MSTLRKKLFNCYFYLFFFLMINRECSPFGIDLRIPCFLLGGILLLLGSKDVICKKQKLSFTTMDIYIIAFFLLAFLSNLVWFFNGLTVHEREFIVIFVSYGFNFLAYLVFRLHQKYITCKNFNRVILFSTLVLLFSMLMAFYGVDISTYLMSGCKGFVEDLSPNFIGGIYRYGGYAEDPNYASLFFVFALATYIYCQKKEQKRYSIIYIALFIFGFLLSASKTTLIAIVPAIVMMLLKNFKFTKFIKTMWMPFVILVPIIFIAFHFDFSLLQSNVSMTQRFQMWEFALDLWKQSPIIGNGFTAFRSYAETVNWWYVQCHSTIFQMLAETGFVSLLLFGIIMMQSLLKNHKYLTFMTTLFSIYMITTETAYHVYFVFILAILPIVVGECELCKKRQSLS